MNTFKESVVQLQKLIVQMGDDKSKTENSRLMKKIVSMYNTILNMVADGVLDSMGTIIDMLYSALNNKSPINTLILKLNEAIEIVLNSGQIPDDHKFQDLLDKLKFALYQKTEDGVSNAIKLVDDMEIYAQRDRMQYRYLFEMKANLVFLKGGYKNSTLDLPIYMETEVETFDLLSKL